MRNEKEYTIRAKFIFRGTVTVSATSRQEAKKKVNESFGMIAGETFATDSSIKDYNVGLHPEKLVR